jgi:hypothetical protein
MSTDYHQDASCNLCCIFLTLADAVLDTLGEDVASASPEERAALGISGEDAWRRAVAAGISTRDEIGLVWLELEKTRRDLSTIMDAVKATAVVVTGIVSARGRARR